MLGFGSFYSPYRLENFEFVVLRKRRCNRGKEGLVVGNRTWNGISTCPIRSLSNDPAASGSFAIWIVNVWSYLLALFQFKIIIVLRTHDGLFG